MLKSLVLGVILCHGICGIFGVEDANRRSDTSMPLLGSMLSVDVNGSRVEIPELKGQYFYSPQQTFYMNVPSAWKWPTSLSNVGKEVRADYTVTVGIGAHKFHRRAVSWNMARRICVEEGGHLADIRTNEEVNAIKALMSAASVDSAWVGFHDYFEEGEWITVLDEPLAKMQWSPWSKKWTTNPDNAGGKEHCAIFLASHAGLNDDNCDKIFSFVCKINV